MFRRRGSAEQVPVPRTEEEIRRWLVGQVAERAQVAPAEVGTARTFESYGLDSRVAVQLSGALERFVGSRLSPGLLYEYVTIDDLSAYLAAELAAPAGSP